ncbi:MAG: hypothetical protein ACRDGM_03135 [bacterium]
MRLLFVSVVLLGLLAASSVAQGFEDVPPWHWSRAAIDSLVAGRIIVGFPPNDRDLALNAVVQVYESFAHASHPQAQTWAERFLANVPRDWPQPLARSRLRDFRFDNPAVRLGRDRGTVSFVTTTVLRSDGSVVTQRGRVTAEVQRADDGRWRANYPSLVSAHPEIFR